MREILTILACCLIGLLTAALAGPYFIDWTAQRDLVEAQIAKATGLKVATRGAIDLKLLPTPRLVLDGAAARGGDGVALQSGKVVLELAVSPLLRGELRFTEASFEAPQIDVHLGADGAVNWPRSQTSLPEDVRFERVAFTNGTLRVVGADGAALLTLPALTLEAEATSLAGPFRGAGSVFSGDDRIGFRFSTGALEDARLRLKFVSDEAGAAPRADLDGSLVIESVGQNYRIAFEGASIFSGKALAGWRLSGPINLDASGMRVDPLELKIGGGDIAIGLGGTGAIDFGKKAEARFTLQARQFDVDRLLALQDGSGAEIAGLPARWIADAGFTARAPLPWRVSLTIPALTIGGETLTEIVADVSAVRGATVAMQLEGNGPGRSRLALNGKLDTGPAARFQGRVEASARDSARLADWVAQASPETAQRLRSVPFRTLEASGEMSLSGAGFSARDMTLRADRSTMKGAAAFTRAIGAERARLFADMNAEALDLDALPDLMRPAAALANMDFSLGLEARAVRVARFGDGMIDAGRIALKVSRAGEAVQLENLSLANIGGASLEANGSADAAGGRLSGSLNAQRLGDFAALLQRVAPGAWSQALAARATSLSPARFAFTADAGRAGDGALQIEHLKLDGAARGTRIEAILKPDADRRDITGSLILESADAPMLVRQFGFESLPMAGAGRARFDARLRGNFETGFDVTTQADVAGARLTYAGAISGSPLAPQMSGQVRVAAADGALFLRLMTFGLPDFSLQLPIDIGARLMVGQGRVNLSSISGAIAGAKVAGEIAGGADANAGGRNRYAGALSIERVSLPALAALILGPAQSARGAALWSDTRFAAGLAEAPLADLKIDAGEMLLAAPFTGRNAQFRLSLAPGWLQVNELKARLGEAALDGRIELRRDGANAAVSGSLGIEGWRLEQRAFSGVLEGRVDFSSTGQSQAALVAGLAGAGGVTVKGLLIPRVDPQAPSRVIAAADEGKIAVSETDFLNALRREFDRSEFAAGNRSFEATLATGVLRFAEPGGLSGAFDFRNQTLDLRTSMSASSLPKDWAGASPQIVVMWKGLLNSPQRDIDAGAFVNALSSRAIARETARIEALEADIRERAAFSRKQRGFAYMRQREREIAAFEIEQARLAAEAERRRLEEERRAAIEERRRVAEAERRRIEEERRLADLARLERELAERERRVADARRREAEAAAARALTQQAPLRLQVVPGAGTDPSAAGRY